MDVITNSKADSQYVAWACNMLWPFMRIVNIERKWIALLRIMLLQIAGIDESSVLAKIVIRFTLFGVHLFVLVCLYWIVYG